MMSYIIIGMMFLAVVFGALTGRMEQVSAAAVGEAAKAVELTLQLMGGMCLWSGVMHVAKESSLTEKLAGLFAPVTKRIFKGLNPKGTAMAAITMNIAANLLGLGNAVTPLGIAAVGEMQKEEKTNHTASNNMALFVVLNTASLQIIPMTTILLRQESGSMAPTEIVLAVWITSLCSVVAALLAAKLFARFWRE